MHFTFTDEAQIATLTIRGEPTTEHVDGQVRRLLQSSIVHAAC